MQMRCWQVYFVLAIAVLCSTSCASLTAGRAERIRDAVAAAVDQVQLGMSQTEVASLLGEPHMKRRIRLSTGYEFWDYRYEDLARRQGAIGRPPLVWLDPRYYLLKESLRFDGSISVMFVNGLVVGVSEL